MASHKYSFNFKKKDRSPLIALVQNSEEKCVTELAFYKLWN